MVFHAYWSEYKKESARQAALGSQELSETFPEGTFTGQQFTAKYIAAQDIKGRLCMEFQIPDWSREDYLLVPAAVYDANRFHIKKVSYPPMFTEEDYALDPPVMTTDIPHFSQKAEESIISLRAGDSSIPAVFVFLKKSQTGMAFLYPCKGDLGENGVILRENPEGLTITIMNPVVRAEGMYRFGEITSKAPCEDLPGKMQTGETAELTVEHFTFPCNNLAEFYQLVLRFSHEKEPIAGPRTVRTPGQDGTPSLAGGFCLVEKKYNLHSWKPNPGYYMVGEGQNLYSDWQTGWVGGIIAAYALYMGGSPVTRGRAKRTFDFLFRHMQAESGFFYGVSNGSEVYGDDFRNIGHKGFTMVRKNADALYYAAKFLLAMKKRREIPDPRWREGLRACADAFVRLFRKYGQLGQFIDIEKEEILVGGSAAGGLVPAGLCLCADYFGDPTYAEVAEEIAFIYEQDYVKKGLLNGGPGEILSAPDSESAYAVLESFVVLYEQTDNTHWLMAAKEAAAIYATWVMPYDYPFLKESMFGEAGMHTTGAVWANVQNKHGAPGPCTFSCAALYRLGQYTGDPIYKKIAEATTNNITQYLSRADRPLWNYDHSAAAPSGFMCERVSTSDWEGFEKIGGVYETGCWCEATLLNMWVDA